MKMRGRRREEESPASPISGAQVYDERLAGVLVALRRVQPYQLDAVRRTATEGTLAEQLIGAGVIGDEDLARTLAEHYGVQQVDFRSTDPQPDAVALLPQELAR